MTTTETTEPQQYQLNISPLPGDVPISTIHSDYEVLYQFAEAYLIGKCVQDGMNIFNIPDEVSNAMHILRKGKMVITQIGGIYLTLNEYNLYRPEVTEDDIECSQDINNCPEELV